MSPASTAKMHVVRERTDVAVAAYVHEVNGDAAPHSHEYIELEIVGAGTGYHVTASGAVPVRAGDMFVLLPGAWHGYSGCERLQAGYVCVPRSIVEADALGGMRTGLARQLLWDRPVSAGGFGVYTATIPEQRARAVVQEMSELSADAERSPRNHLLQYGRLLTILGIVLDSTSFEPDRREAHPALRLALARIREAPGDDWSIERLARLASVDPAHLSRLFRRHLGLTPMAYLARLRMSHATRLLRDTDDPVAKVGADVGWPDPAHFARRFRALTGMTPREYRRQRD